MASTNPTIIDLQKYASENNTSFSTRTMGIKVRNESHIDELVKEHDNVTIYVSNNIDSVSIPFLEELFRNVAHTLTLDGFKRKIKFDNQGAYKIDFYVSEALSRILREDVEFAY